MNDNQLSFRKLLNKYRDIPVFKLLAADAVDSKLIVGELIKLNEVEFETVCEYVYNYIMHSELDCYKLVDYIHDASIQGFPIFKLILDGEWEDADEIIYSIM